jgi:cytochrome c oxidase subunit 4
VSAEHGDDIDATYMKIFVVLFVLTVVEVGAAKLPMNKWLIGFTLLALAFFKAGLVAAFYMHLKFEGRLLYLVCSIPIVLVALLTLGLTPDVAHRVGATTRPGASPAPVASAGAHH